MTEDRGKTQMMEKLNKLTKREQILIYIMICVLVLAAGIFLVFKPMISWHSNVNDEYSKLKSEKQQMETAINSEASAKGQIKEYKRNIARMHNFYYDKMSNNQIDELLTGVIRLSGMKPLSLEIGVDVDVSAIAGSSETVEDKGETGNQGAAASKEEVAQILQDAAKEAGGESGVVAVSTSNVVIDQVAATASGDFADFARLLAAVEARDGMHIISISFQEGSFVDNIVAENTITGRETAVSTAAIVFEVYQMKDIK